MKNHSLAAAKVRRANQKTTKGGNRYQRAKMEPKGTKREPNGRGAKSEPKGDQDASKNESSDKVPNIMQKCSPPYLLL